MDLSLWIVLCGVGTLVIRVAYALHVAGMARSKNSAGAVMRLVVDMALATLAFWFIGGALADNSAGLVSWRLIASGGNASGAAGWFFFLTAILVSTGAVVGVVGERSRFFPMCAAPVALAAVVIPLSARWTIGGGWLQELGFVDFAGAASIQLTAAVAGLVMAVMVGARNGKYNRDGSSNAIPGHSVPLASLGVLLTAIGWLAYLLGFARTSSGAGVVAMNAMLAGASGATISLIIGHVRYYKPDIHITYAGLMGGLVAISAAAGTQSSWMAVLIGLAAGAAAPTVGLMIDLVWKVDDVTGAIGVHGVGAIIGLLMAPFATALPWVERFKALGTQVLGIVVVAALTAAVFVPLYYILGQTVGLRSKEADEYDGLDLAEHDIGAYPDFQQTMIKSYHLREA